MSTTKRKTTSKNQNSTNNVSNLSIKLSINKSKTNSGTKLLFTVQLIDKELHSIITEDSDFVIV